MIQQENEPEVEWKLTYTGVGKPCGRDMSNSGLTVVGVFGLFSVNAPVLVEDGDIWVILDSSMIYHQCTHIQCINGEFSNLATDLEILEWVSIYCCTCSSCPEILPSSFALPLFLCILRQPSN